MLSMRTPEQKQRLTTVVTAGLRRALWRVPARAAVLAAGVRVTLCSAVLAVHAPVLAQDGTCLVAQVATGMSAGSLRRSVGFFLLYS